MPRILILEDDSLTLALLSGFLEDQGFGVVKAENIATLYVELEKQSVDVALLDVCLPDGNGIEAFLQSPHGANIPIICMTSNATEARAWQDQETLVKDYIIKPINEEVLLDRINRLLVEASSVAQIALDTQGKINLDRKLEKISGIAKEVNLTGAESNLLACLCLGSSQPISRNNLSLDVLGRAHQSEDRSIDVLIGRVRQKLKRAGSASQIVAVRNKGYRFVIL